jgi:hypothetical protein
VREAAFKRSYTEPPVPTPSTRPVSTAGSYVMRWSPRSGADSYKADTWKRPSRLAKSWLYCSSLASWRFGNRWAYRRDRGRQHTGRAESGA